MLRRVVWLLICCSALPVMGQIEPPASNRFVAELDVRPEDAQVVWTYDSVFVNRSVFDENRDVGLSSPCVVDGRVYVGDDTGALLAFDAQTGDQIWRHEHGDRIFWTPVSDGTRVFVCSTKWVEAVSCGDGKSIWKHAAAETGGLALWPPRMPGRNKIQMLYVADSDGLFNGYLSWKGIRRLRGTLMDDVQDDPPGFNGRRARMRDAKARPYGVSTDGERVYQAVFDQARVIAFNAISGNVEWAFDTNGWVGTTPSVDGEDVFIGSQDKRLYCLDRTTGTKKWEFATDSRVSAAPAVHGDRLYASSCDGHMYCLDRATGREIWRYMDTDEPRSVIYTDPILTETTIYFAVGKGLMYAVNTDDGSLRWKLRPFEHAQLYSDFATDGTRLFITSRPKGKGEGKSALLAVGPE